MAEDKKNRDVFYITHKGELLIWLIIILIGISVFSIFYSKNIQDDNDYTIFMDDVDGLIVGSPVRMMGIEVGHITKIKPTNTEIYVKFIIDDKNIILPQGSVATVEFSGMAGSKSLELYLPDKTTYIDKNVPLLSVEQPKRLHDAASLLNEMFDKINSIIYMTSSFNNKIKRMNIDVDTKAGITDFIDYADDIVSTSNTKVLQINKKLEQYKRSAKR